MTTGTDKPPHRCRRWRCLFVTILLILALGAGLYTQWPASKQSEIDSLKQEVTQLTHSLVDLNQKLGQLTPPDLSPIEARLQALEEAKPSSTAVSSTTAASPAFETLLLYQVFEWAFTAGQDVNILASQLIQRIPGSEPLIKALKTQLPEQNPSKLLKPFQKFVSVQSLGGQSVDKVETLRQLKKLVYEQFMKELK